jgi:hypothetical protein
MMIASSLGTAPGAALDTAQGAGANLFDIVVHLDGNNHRATGRISSRNVAKLI